MSDAIQTVVADTVIFLQSSINESNVASSFLRRVAAEDIEMWISRQVIAEIRDVLTRREIRAKNRRLSDEDLERFIQAIEANARLVDPMPSHVTYMLDPDDEHVLNLAIEAQARYHVSYDNDLLALMDAKKPEGYAFQLVHPELTIITAGEFITRLNLFQSKVHSSSGLME